MNIEEFIKELQIMGIEINNEQLDQLEKYYKLLIEYNKVMNLTGITEIKEVYLKHFYDSLTLNKSVNLKDIENLCDIGSGAGFPGLVIKILFPKINIVLVDSLNKRVEFLNTVIKELELKNIIAVHERAEIFARNNISKFDLVTARAVSKLNIILELGIPMVKENGFFIAMKANVDEELRNIDEITNKLNCKLVDLKKFKLPFENSTRTLIKIKKIGKTENKYPRKFEQIKKKPL